MGSADRRRQMSRLHARSLPNLPQSGKDWAISAAPRDYGDICRNLREPLPPPAKLLRVNSVFLQNVTKYCSQPLVSPTSLKVKVWKTCLSLPSVHPQRGRDCADVGPAPGNGVPGHAPRPDSPAAPNVLASRHRQVTSSLTLVSATPFVLTIPFRPSGIKGTHAAPSSLAE